MTAEERTTPEEPVVTGEVPAAGPAELRAAYDREKSRNKALTDEIMGIRLADIGLNPQVGLGKAIAKEYDGDLSVEALAEYARSEYGHEGTVETAPADLQAAQRADAAMSVGEPIPPAPSAEEQQQAALATAAAQGDVKASIAMKLQQQQE